MLAIVIVVGVVVGFLVGVVVVVVVLVIGVVVVVAVAVAVISETSITSKRYQKYVCWGPKTRYFWDRFVNCGDGRRSPIALDCSENSDR